MPEYSKTSLGQLLPRRWRFSGKHVRSREEEYKLTRGREFHRAIGAVPHEMEKKRVKTHARTSESSRYALKIFVSAWRFYTNT